MKDFTRPAPARLIVNYFAAPPSELGRNEVKFCAVGSLNHLERASEVERLAERAGLFLLSVEPPEAHGPHLARGKGQVAPRFDDLASHALDPQGVECIVAPLVVSCLAEILDSLLTNRDPRKSSRDAGEVHTFPKLDIGVLQRRPLPVDRVPAEKLCAALGARRRRRRDATRFSQSFSVGADDLVARDET